MARSIRMYQTRQLNGNHPPSIGRMPAHNPTIWRLNDKPNLNINSSARRPMIRNQRIFFHKGCSFQTNGYAPYSVNFAEITPCAPKMSMQIEYKTRYPAYNIISHISIFAMIRPLDRVSRPSGLFSKKSTIVESAELRLIDVNSNNNP